MRPGGAVTKWTAGLARTMRACSACAGDYEDPDRTAPPTGEEQPGWDDDAAGHAGDDSPEDLPVKAFDREATTQERGK